MVPPVDMMFPEVTAYAEHYSIVERVISWIDMVQSQFLFDATFLTTVLGACQCHRSERLAEPFCTHLVSLLYLRSEHASL